MGSCTWTAPSRQRDATVTRQVERAREGDIAAIAAIEQRCFSDPWSECSFRDVLAHPRIFFACIRDVADGSVSPVLGYVVAWFISSQGEIANLAVDPLFLMRPSRRPAERRQKRCSSKSGIRIFVRGSCTNHEDSWR